MNGRSYNSIHYRVGFVSALVSKGALLALRRGDQMPKEFHTDGDFRLNPLQHGVLKLLLSCIRCSEKRSFVWLRGMSSVSVKTVEIFIKLN
jgi:hypothetical protein